jgi:hypothetical protein
MAAKKRGAKPRKRATVRAQRKVAPRPKAKATARKGAAKKGAAKARRAGSRPPGPVRKAPPSRAATKTVGQAVKAPPVTVTAATLQVVQLEPLRSEAAAAFARGETVLLKTGTSEDGGRVETLVFAPSWKGAQSAGTFVHRGDWSGEQLVTDRGHLLDLDGNCFCRDCEAAKGYTLDDDE